MKKIIFILLILATTSVFSQSVFSKYETDERVTALVVSKKMLEMVASIETSDPETQRFSEIIKRISEIQFFSTADVKAKEQLEIDVNNHIKLNKLQEIAHKSGVKIYAKPTSTPQVFAQLFVLFQENEQQMLLLVTGQIGLNDLEILAKKMNLPSEIGI